MTSLNLPQNGISFISATIHHLASLRRVNLQGNALDAEKLAGIIETSPTIQDMNLAQTSLSCSDAKLVAEALACTSALTSITFGNKEAITMKAGMAGADFIGKELGPSDAVIVASFIPKCQ